MDQTELAELKKLIIDLLKVNKIWVSDSPFGASILFSKKKDRLLHLCIDYCALNKNTISDFYPLPGTEELLFQLKGAKYFLHLDLRDGYFHIPIAKQDV